MFEIKRDNVAGFIAKNWDAYSLESEKSDTWRKVAGKKDELALLDKFWLSRFGDGVLDPPIKCSLAYLAGALPRCFRSEHPITRRLYLSALKNMLVWPLQSLSPKAEFDTLIEAGIVMPQDRKSFPELFYSFDGKIFNANIRRYAAQFMVISSNARFDSPFSACEIGGGYGGFAELFCMNQKNLDNYYIIDLFETLAISMTYLAKQNPGGRRLFFVEKKGDLKGFQEKDCIVFIPASLAEEVLEARDVRLFVNSSSIMEMAKPVIERYFRIIQSYGGVYFYNYNSITRMENGELMAYDDLPYDSGWMPVFDRTINIPGMVSNIRETIRYRK